MEGGVTHLKTVPTPVEIPEPPDLSHLPAPILHSGTVETLIGHNEDLTARLMVNIRRNGVLEGQIIEHERINRELASSNQAMLTQIEVFKEKQRIATEKASQIDDRADFLRETVQSLTEKVEELEDDRAYFKQTARAGVRFRRRVDLWVRPLLDLLKTDLKNERNLRIEREAAVVDLRAELNEAREDARSQENKFSRDQTKLVEQYEARLAGLRNVKEKAQRFDEAVSKKTELENRIVLIERQRDDALALRSEELRTLQAQMVQYRQEAKALAAENLQLKSKIESSQSQINDLTDQHERLQDQFESVRSVWAESQKKLESAKLQQETLNKLNQELSRQLKDYRQNRGPDAAI